MTEIQLAIKIGRLRLGDLRLSDVDTLDFISSLDLLGVNYRSTPCNSTYCNKYLKVFAPHTGDFSLLKFVRDIDLTMKSDYNDLLFFMAGIMYLYPFRSFVDEILPDINAKIGQEISIFDIDKFVIQEYKTIK